LNHLNSSTKTAPKKKAAAGKAEIGWDSTLEEFLGKANIKSIEKLNTAGIQEVRDLLSNFPLCAVFNTSKKAAFSSVAQKF